MGANSAAGLPFYFQNIGFRSRSDREPGEEVRKSRTLVRAADKGAARDNRAPLLYGVGFFAGAGAAGFGVAGAADDPAFIG
jgi:hypothetical protein